WRGGHPLRPARPLRPAPVLPAALAGPGAKRRGALMAVQITSRHYPDRAAAEADYLRRVDIYIGGVRAQVITAVPGQAETYQAKAADADAFLAAADPDPTDFPWVAAEARATGVT